MPKDAYLFGEISKIKKSLALPNENVYIPNMISWSDFEKIDLRVGTVLSASEFPAAKKPAYQLTIDFGELGIKKSSAQLTKLYSCEALVGKQIVAVVNFPPKQIANFFSECLVLGIAQENVILLHPERAAPNGARIG